VGGASANAKDSLPLAAASSSVSGIGSMTILPTLDGAASLTGEPSGDGESSSAYGAEQLYPSELRHAAAGGDTLPNADIRLSDPADACTVGMLQYHAFAWCVVRP
jgi:hypothetical protein